LDIRDNFPILICHKIIRGLPLDSTAISPSKFKTIIKSLYDEHYTFLTLKEANNTSVRKGVIFCFDDIYNHLVPLFLELSENYSFKATLFTIAGYLGTYNFWEPLPGKRVKHISQDETILLSACGYEIGSHTLTHPDLIHLPPEKLYQELYISKDILEQLIKKEITSISFPFSRIDDSIAKIAWEIGYRNSAVLRKHSLKADWIKCGWGVYKWDNHRSVKRKMNGNNSERLLLNLVSKCSYFSALLRNLLYEQKK